MCGQMFGNDPVHTFVTGTIYVSASHYFYNLREMYLNLLLLNIVKRLPLYFLICYSDQSFKMFKVDLLEDLDKYMVLETHVGHF